MIYFHEQGSEDAIRECVYEGFIRGKIYWDLHNRYNSKEIACINDANIKIAEVKGEIFEYFFSN